MEVTIYKTNGCSYCVKVIELMERAKTPYELVVVGVDITRQEFKSMFPKANGFPHVIIDGKEVGGLVETVKYYVENNLITSK